MAAGVSWKWKREALELEESAVDQDVVEATVHVDLTVVFTRPALNSAVVAVLQRQDIVVVERQRLQTSAKFLRVIAGTWVREKRNRTTLFQLKEHGWVLRALPSSPTERVVTHIPPSRNVLCYEVVGKPVEELLCPMPGGYKVHVWPQGSVIEAVEELPGDWLRLTARDEQCEGVGWPPMSPVPPARSTFVYRGSSNPADEDCRLKLRGSKAQEVKWQSIAKVSTPEEERAKPSRPKRLSDLSRGSAATGAAATVAKAEAPATPSEAPPSPQASQSAELASPTSESIARKSPVAYFGIVDLKYDRQKEEGNRVKVLELGSGLSSRFSGHGEEILKKYQASFALHKKLDRDVLVDNKKRTHDVFHECGYGALRPAQVCYPRLYHKDLHTTLAKELGINHQQGAPVVLKLVNRCRGAGVVVVRTGQELDDTLRLLLQPPEDSFELGSVTLDVALSADSSSMHEQCLHWWSNECPFFVAECCELSHPVKTQSAQFDGTMRIAFVLIRKENAETDREAAKLGIEFLGGYWKLPSAPVTSTDVRARCLSKARTGTCPVDAADLEHVEDQLRDVLPDVFSIERAGAGTLARRYSKNAMIFSFVMARHAVSQLPRELNGKAVSQNVLKLLTMASNRVRELPKGIPQNSAASHINRQEGAIAAASGDWDAAVKKWRCSLDLFPWNATSEHLIGYHHLRQHEWLEAELCFTRSLCLDPEFKASYANLSATYLALEKYADAKRVAYAGLKRHPFAFQCSYNLGIAAAVLLKMSFSNDPKLKNMEDMAVESRDALTDACFQKESLKSDWAQSDDELLEVVTQLAEHFSAGREVAQAQEMMDRIVPCQGWNIRNFRP